MSGTLIEQDAVAPAGTPELSLPLSQGLPARKRAPGCALGYLLAPYFTRTPPAMPAPTSRPLPGWPW